MFNIPGKQALTITETATAQIRKLMEQGNKKGLRVGVKKGGCFCKGQIISKGLMVSSNSPKKQTNEFVFTTTKNSFVRFLGEF